MTHSVHDIFWRTPGRLDDERIFASNDVKKIEKIKKHAKQPDAIKSDAVNELLSLFNAGQIVPASDIPCNIVTIGSRILIRQKHDDTTLKITLDTTKQGSDKVSVLSPLGIATLGLSVSDDIEFYTQKGVKFLTIDKILYQPQSFGNFN